MSLQGIDIAWARPTTGQILATGAHWVGRYLSNDSTKNLQLGEVASYPAAGLAIVVVWETTTGRALQGFAAGQTDARAADQQRRGLGLPDDMPIHFAVDTDTTWATVQAYFDGAASIIGTPRVGAYGGYAVIEGAAAAGLRYLWQTVAWSAGRWSAHATIRQPGGTVLQGQADLDVAVATDFGQYPRPQETDMPLTTADAQLVAKTLLGTTLPSPFRTDAQGKPQEISVASYLEWLDAHYDATMRAIAGLAAQNSALAAAVAVLSKEGGPTAAEIQTAAENGAQAALAVLAHALTTPTQPAATAP